MMKRYLILLLAALVCCQARAQRPGVSILGDSYSTFENFVEPDSNLVWYWKKHDGKRTDLTDVRQTWWQLFVRRNGCRLCVNNSFSGATICYTGYKRNDVHQDYSDRSFITRAPHLGSPDVLFVFGGTNDSWAGAPVGEYLYENWTREDLYAYRPALAYLLDDLSARHPNTRIYVLLNDGLREEIDESTRTICQHYGIPCIALQGIDKQNNHPTQLGMQQICCQIETFIRNETTDK